MLFSQTANATTWYVNDSGWLVGDFCIAAGNDANDGLSPATPKFNMFLLLNTAVNSGDTVLIDNGNYTFSGISGASLSNKNNITILGFSKSTCVQDISSITSHPIELVNCQNIAIKNFMIHNQDSTIPENNVITINQSHNIEIDSMKLVRSGGLTNNHSTALNITNNAPSSSVNFIRIKHCFIQNALEYNSGFDTKAGVYVAQENNKGVAIYLENNVFVNDDPANSTTNNHNIVATNTSGSIMNTPDIHILQNQFLIENPNGTDPMINSCLHTENIQNKFIIKNNYFYSFFSGITFGNASNLSSSEIVNNSFLSNDFNIHFSPSSQNQMILANNLLGSINDVCLKFESDFSASKFEYANYNIFDASNSSVVEINTLPNNLNTYKTTDHAISASSLGDENSIEIDLSSLIVSKMIPDYDFNNPASFPSNNLDLQAGNIGSLQGNASYAPNIDIYGTLRTGVSIGPDIGAFEDIPIAPFALKGYYLIDPALGNGPAGNFNGYDYQQSFESLKKAHDTLIARGMTDTVVFLLNGNTLDVESMLFDNSIISLGVSPLLIFKGLAGHILNTAEASATLFRFNDFNASIEFDSINFSSSNHNSFCTYLMTNAANQHHFYTHNSSFTEDFSSANRSIFEIAQIGHTVFEGNYFSGNATAVDINDNALLTSDTNIIIIQNTFTNQQSRAINTSGGSGILIAQNTITSTNVNGTSFNGLLVRDPSYQNLQHLSIKQNSIVLENITTSSNNTYGIHLSDINHNLLEETNITNNEVSIMNSTNARGIKLDLIGSPSSSHVFTLAHNSVFIENGISNAHALVLSNINTLESNIINNNIVNNNNTGSITFQQNLTLNNISEQQNNLFSINNLPIGSGTLFNTNTLNIDPQFISTDSLVIGNQAFFDSLAQGYFLDNNTDGFHDIEFDINQEQRRDNSPHIGAYEAQRVLYYTGDNGGLFENTDNWRLINDSTSQSVPKTLPTKYDVIHFTDQSFENACSNDDPNSKIVHITYPVRVKKIEYSGFCRPTFTSNASGSIQVSTFTE